MKLSDIHTTLNEVRKQRGLSQKDIAEMLNVEQATVSMYETGKRGIPLDVLDEWLRLLEIEVKIIPKGFGPVKPEKDVEQDLAKFGELKKRRNYLIAELRAFMAEHLLQVPEFQLTAKETGEGKFWPYSFRGDEYVGLVETRCDHPEQRYMAIEYTSEEVNAYKFLTSHETGGDESDQEWLKINRVYFSEDDFLTLGEVLGQDGMEIRKMTILRKNVGRIDGVEIVDPEGFSLGSLMEMHKNFILFTEKFKECEKQVDFKAMEDELEDVRNKLADLTINNRLGNGAVNPEFVFWDDDDINVVSVPLGDTPRRWKWVEEGVEWVENYQEMEEVLVIGDSIPHQDYPVQRNEDGNRIVGLIGSKETPAVFKVNPNRPELIYRVEVSVEELNEKELEDYKKILNATKGLKELGANMSPDE